MTTRPDRDPADDEPPTSGQIVVVSAVVYGLLGMSGYWWLGWRDRVSVLAETAVGSHGPFVSALLGTALGLVLFALARLAARYVRAFAALEARLAETIGPLEDHHALWIALVAGAAEEVFFRCAMQDAFGYWPTALLYAAGHLGGRGLWWWSLPALVLGLVFGWLVMAGFGILSAALAHAVFSYLWLRRLSR